MKSRSLNLVFSGYFNYERHTYGAYTFRERMKRFIPKPGQIKSVKFSAETRKQYLN